MTKLRIHDGEWKEGDKIDPLSPLDQYFPNFVMVQEANKKLENIGLQRTSSIGIDTEMLVLSKGEVLWPFDEGFPQERKPRDTRYGDGEGSFDLHADGMATELCTKPHYCLEQLIVNIGTAFDWLQYRNKEGVITDTRRAIELYAPALYNVPAAVIDRAPDEAKRLGCMPSINIYGESGDPTSLKDNVRTTGCHLHISHPVMNDESIAMALVKWADILVGCTWTYISPLESTSEAERRKAYGRAGEFRLKTYPFGAKEHGQVKGVEYRVLPGAVMYHPAYLTLLFSLYRSALRIAAQYGEPQQDLSQLAQHAINTADRRKAKSVIRSVPIAENGRKLIRFMRRRSLKSSGALDAWLTKGRDHKGHVGYYIDHTIELSALSL